MDAGRRTGRGQRSGRRPTSAISTRRIGRALKEEWHMNLDTATDLIRQTLVLALLASAHMLVIGVVVGVLVSLLQAVTQIQEQSLAFIPKIVAMVGAVVVFMP